MRSGILKNISKVLLEQKQTVSTAESVTAGLISNALARAENATKFLQGGIIVYNLGQKTRLLSVDPIYADLENCVSAEVTIQMAMAVTKMFCSHWGIAITGYATPVPALNIRSRFAYYALVHRSEIVVSGKIETRLVAPQRVQQFYMERVLSAFSKHL